MQTRLDRRSFLALGAGATAFGPAAAAPRSLRGRQDDHVLHDVVEWGVEGRGWTAVARPYDRLPEQAQATVRQPVWDLSRHSAGMLAHFATDATALRCDVELLNPGLAMPHMPASGMSGVDLYACEEAGPWRWVGGARPETQTYSVEWRGLRPGRREYRLYLPLYNGVERLQVGVPPGAAFAPIVPRRNPPLVYHGTSIAHGACASRPGMAFVNILGRRLDVPVLNLAFSGNGRLEPELAELLAEIDAAAYVLDCLPNLNAEQVAERAVPFVLRLREAHPGTPIVLVEDRTNADAIWLPGRATHHAANHAALSEAYAKLLRQGVGGLSYVPDAPFLGVDGEGTVDGSHPNDLGMMRYADALEPAIRAALA